MSSTDKTEMGVRFGCGFVFGLVLFGLSSMWFAFEGRRIDLVIALVAAFAFGLAALRFGDAFWGWVARWLRCGV